MLKNLGVQKAPKEAQNDMYSGKWKTIKHFDLENDVPKKIKLPEEEGQMYYLVQYRTLLVIIKAPKNRELSPWEQEQKKREKAKRQIKAILKESSARRKELIQDIISGKIDAVKDEAKEIDLVWKALAPLGSCIYESTLRRFFLGKDEYKCTEEERRDAQEKVDSLSTLHQMLVILHTSMAGTNETFDYNLNFSPAKGNALQNGYKALVPYGWYFNNEDEIKVLDGTHVLYAKGG